MSGRYSLNNSTQIFNGSFSQSRSKDPLRAATVYQWALAQALASMTDQTQKSIGLRSGRVGGHSYLYAKFWTLLQSHLWALLVAFANAPSCFKRNSPPSSISWLKFFTTGFRKSCSYLAALMMAPSGTNTSEFSQLKTHQPRLSQLQPLECVPYFFRMSSDTTESCTERTLSFWWLRTS